MMKHGLRALALLLCVLLYRRLRMHLPDVL